MANKFNLERTISSEVRLKIRQKCGFGCILCGNVIIQYHHFNPPYSEAKEHTVEGITLLCGICHQMAHNGIYSSEFIPLADVNPFCGNRGHAKIKIFRGNTLVPVKIGTSLIHAESILMYDDKLVFGFLPPEVNNGPIRLNANFTDSNGQEILKIIDNEWLIGHDCYDVQTTKSRMRIRDKLGKTSLEITLSADKTIEVTKIDMYYKGFKIFANKEYFSLKVPQGATLKHKGSSYADIGIWMKSDGHALIAANKNGGAAIGM